MNRVPTFSVILSLPKKVFGGTIQAHSHHPHCQRCPSPLSEHFLSAILSPECQLHDHFASIIQSNPLNLSRRKPVTAMKIRVSSSLCYRHASEIILLQLPPVCRHFNNAPTQRIQTQNIRKHLKVCRYRCFSRYNSSLFSSMGRGVCGCAGGVSFASTK